MKSRNSRLEIKTSAKKASLAKKKFYSTKKIEYYDYTVYEICTYLEPYVTSSTSSDMNGHKDGTIGAKSAL